MAFAAIVGRSKDRRHLEHAQAFGAIGAWDTMSRDAVEEVTTLELQRLLGAVLASKGDLPPMATRVPESRTADAATLDTHAAFHHLNVDGMRVQRLVQSLNLRAWGFGQWAGGLWRALGSSHWAGRACLAGRRGAAGIGECPARGRRAGRFRLSPSACTFENENPPPWIGGGRGGS